MIMIEVTFPHINKIALIKVLYFLIKMIETLKAHAHELLVLY